MSVDRPSCAVAHAAGVIHALPDRHERWGAAASLKGSCLGRIGEGGQGRLISCDILIRRLQPTPSLRETPEAAWAALART
jgi:hypothetical protein